MGAGESGVGGGLEVEVVWVLGLLKVKLRL